MDFLDKINKDIALPTNRGIKTKGNIYEVYSQLGRNLPISAAYLRKGRFAFKL